MTFTEAAVAVLRSWGKPLHYRRITELAIERNLLSHVGKTPEITMSSRLATMVKKDRGEAPIVKVKPGIFGLRDFTGEVIAEAVADPGLDDSEGEELPVNQDEPSAEGARSQDDREPAAAPQAAEAPRRKLPGEDVFPAEADDDQPILRDLGERHEGGGGAGAGAGGPGPRRDDGERRGRRRRRRGRGGEGGGQGDRQFAGGGGGGGGGGGAERHAPQAPRHEPGPRDHGPREHGGGREPVRGDWNREQDHGEATGHDLAEAVRDVLEQGGRNPLPYARIAEQLVRRGRLAGSPDALAPTVAAAVRSDSARRAADHQRPRFRASFGRVGLVDWALPPEAVRFEREAARAAERQREIVRRAFVRRVADLPAAGFVELLASFLNAEGVGGLRAVRRPGVLRRGFAETRIAVVVCGTEIGREQVIEVRGALHHYDSASVAWIITLRDVKSGAREEAAVPGTAPVSLFDGIGLAKAMERAGIGLVRFGVPVVAIDLDLFEGLGAGAARPHGDARRDERDDRGPRAEGADSGAEARGEANDDDADDLEGNGDREGDRQGDEGGAEGDATGGAEGAPGEGGGRRRRRRGSGRGTGESASGSIPPASAAAADGAEAGDPAESDLDAADEDLDDAESDDVDELGDEERGGDAERDDEGNGDRSDADEGDDDDERGEPFSDDERGEGGP
jgi:hypothetical protein